MGTGMVLSLVVAWIQEKCAISLLLSMAISHFLQILLLFVKTWNEMPAVVHDYFSGHALCKINWTEVLQILWVRQIKLIVLICVVHTHLHADTQKHEKLTHPISKVSPPTPSPQTHTQHTPLRRYSYVVSADAGGEWDGWAVGHSAAGYGDLWRWWHGCCGPQRMTATTRARVDIPHNHSIPDIHSTSTIAFLHSIPHFTVILSVWHNTYSSVAFIKSNSHVLHTNSTKCIHFSFISLEKLLRI